MKQLNKQHQKDVADALGACRDASNKLNAAITAYNEAMAPHKEAVEEALEEYNNKVGELKSVYEGIANDARGYFDERTERWQESETGQAYEEWVEQLEELDIEEVEIELPEEIDFPDDIPDLEGADFLPPDEPG